VLEEYTPGGVIKVSYVYGNDLISQDRGGAKSFYHVDGLGSTRALTNASGVVTDRYVYDAFGRTIGQPIGNTPNSYLFAGEQRDANVGLDYLRARYLSVGTGRLYGRDPLLQTSAGVLLKSAYLYAGGNPVNMFDPSGMISLGDVALIFAYQENINRYIEGTRAFNLVRNGVAPRKIQAYLSELILEAATAKLGSDEYAVKASKGVLPTNTNKCNLFVYDVLAEAGIAPPLRPRRFGLVPPQYPPLAGDYADPTYPIPNLTVVSGPPQAGDIIAAKKFYLDASGHAGIVSDPEHYISVVHDVVVEGPISNFQLQGFGRIVLRRPKAF
jgi:RHS repeat-associated protein